MRRPPSRPPARREASSTRESHARCGPALLAVRPLALGRATAHGRCLSARLARAPPPRPLALARRPSRRVPWRAPGDLPGPGLADRAVRRPAAPNPHGAAPAANDGGPAVAVAGRAPVPFAPGLAPAHPRFLGRAPAVCPAV